MNWGVFVLSFALASGVFAKVTSEECMACHDGEAATYKTSIHASVGCTDCHAGMQAYPHGEKVAKVNCDTCHSGMQSSIAGSVHAKANGGSCSNCHGDNHKILAASDPKSPVYGLNLPKTCGGCHGDAKFAKQHNLSEVYSQYTDSIHGFALKDGLLVAANCSSCHGSHKILSKKDPKSRTNQENVAATCGTCHAGVLQVYDTSIHGRALANTGDLRAPTCTSCHTAHQIASVRTAEWQMKTTATCGNCHSEEYKTYRDTFHAQVSALGYVRTARCWDCHENHAILPKSDPRSSINAANLTATCGKCHHGANASFVSYQPHADAANSDQFPALHYSAIFMNLLLSGTLGFFALHTILWAMRSWSERKKAREYSGR